MNETDQPTAKRRCAQCKALAVPGLVLCETHRKKMRAYMANRKLRIDVQARGFTTVLAEVNEQLLKVEAKRNVLVKYRKAWGG